MNEAEFLRKLHEAFEMEADEHFAVISKTLAEIEHLGPVDLPAGVERIFREMHSLKGAARAVGRSDIEALCQVMEGLFALWKRNPVTITADPWAGALDLRAALIAPNGQVVGSSVQNTRAGEMLGAALSAILPDTGVYLLTITAANEASGDFLLSLAGRPALTGAPLAFGEAVDVSLTPQEAPQYFVFEARDCPTTLTITNLSEGQPFTYPFAARVLDQRGHDVALLRGGEQLEDWVTVAAHSGRYEVEVRSADPAAAGDLRLRVSCAAEAPGCLAGQAALSGVPGAGPAACLPCPGPGDSITGGGGPALDFAVTQDSGDPLRATVTWNPMAAATGYSVYVYGRTPDSGDVYLTHGTWTPGDPTAFPWTLPEGYISFRFELRVYVGETRVCTAETGLSFEIPGEPPPSEQILCQIHTERADVRARVGPGLGRAAFAFLAPGVNYPVTGFAFDSAGNRWWQIDKSLIPGHEAALSLWVLASEVIGDGMCEQVPPAGRSPNHPGPPSGCPTRAVDAGRARRAGRLAAVRVVRHLRAPGQRVRNVAGGRMPVGSRHLRGSASATGRGRANPVLRHQRDD